ncbi:MAG: HAD family phosphatase [bacterium]|nr:HAD family phosphatase [bacterium]
MSRSIPPTSDGHVDTVVWDFGNVLVRWDPAVAFAPRWERERFEELAERAGFWTLNDNMDASIDNAELVEELALRDPEAAEFWRHYEEHMPSSLFPDIEGTSELLHELADAGIAQYGLTNWNRTLAPEIPTVVPGSTRLKGCVVSSLEGVVKPSPEIFEILIDRYGLTPSRTLFIDDREENTAAAARLGFHVHTFDTPGGAPALRAHMRELGLPVAGAPAPGQ